MGNIAGIVDPITRAEINRIRTDLYQLQNTFGKVIQNATVVQSHADLQDLAFDDSGHTGFASSAQLTAHTTDTTNPHSVTLQQVVDQDEVCTTAPWFKDAADAGTEHICIKLGVFDSDPNIEAYRIITDDDTGDKLTFFSQRWQHHTLGRRQSSGNIERDVWELFGAGAQSGRLSLWGDDSNNIVLARIQADADSYLNGSSAKLGIGNAAPSVELDVTGQGAFSDKVSATGTGTTVPAFHAVASPSGSVVGLGTEDSATMLIVQGGQDASVDLFEVRDVFDSVHTTFQQDGSISVSNGGLLCHDVTASGFLKSDEFVDLEEISGAPWGGGSNPAAGRQFLFFASGDNKLYRRDSGGTNTLIGAGESVARQGSAPSAPPAGPYFWWDTTAGTADVLKIYSPRSGTWVTTGIIG